MPKPRSKPASLAMPALALFVSSLLGAPTPVGAATVLSEGHVDISVAYDSGRWAPGVKTDSSTLPADGVVLKVPLAARRPAPDSPAFANCLGTAATPVWLLPQVQTSGLLFLGYITNVPAGTFTDNRVNLTLRSAEGPGQVCVYTTSAFGTPNVIFNTRDGIAAADAVVLDGQSHGHWNWSFSTPGPYRLGLEVSGATPAGPSSASVVYTFEVEGDSPAATVTPAVATATPVAATATPTPTATSAAGTATPAATSAASTATPTATPPATDPTLEPTVAPPASPTPPLATPTVRPTQPPAASPSLPPGIMYGVRSSTGWVSGSGP